jgi:(4-O-methyl)-D-glucuronate---lignin esterase
VVPPGAAFVLDLARDQVTNLWAKRMIGDRLLPEDERCTFSRFKPYKKDSRLLESDLLGPVTLLAVTSR